MIRPGFWRLCRRIVAILECQCEYRLRFQITRKRFDESSHDSDISGVRIAQLLVLPFASPEVEVTDELPRSVRGAGGFGSTGLR